MRLSYKYLNYSIILLLVMGFFLGDPVHAANQTQCSTDMTAQLNQILHLLLSLLSWIWIPLATLAGKLMGNGFVYGEFLNLDKVLYYLRNISRTFANFLIVGLLLYKIIQDSINGTIDGTDILKYIISKLLVGVVAINISWFVLGALVDVSTLLTTASSGIAHSYIANNGSAMRDTIKLSLQSKGKPVHTLNLSAGLCDMAASHSVSYTPTSTDNQEIEKLLDSIIPNEKSLSGPLIYLGSSVIAVDHFLYNNNNPDAYIDNLFVISTRLTIIVVFVIALIMLIVINIFRIMMIWIFAAFGPLIVLFIITKQDNILNTIKENIKIELSFPQLLKSIFAPVIAVSLMSIGLMVIILMQNYLQLKPNITWGDAYMKTDKHTSHIGVQGVFETSLAGDILGNDTNNMIKNTFTNILLILFTLFILYGIIHALTKFMDNGFGGNMITQINKLSNLTWQSIKVPLPNNEKISLKSALNYPRKRLERNSHILNNNLLTQEQILENKFRSKLGLEVHLLPQDYETLTKLSQQFKKETKPLTTIHYNNLITESLALIDKANYRNFVHIGFHNMKGVPGALEAFLQNLAKNQVKTFNFIAPNIGTTGIEWEQSDNIDELITKNYKDPIKKKLFQIIYEDLGGNSKRLKANGSNFWSMPISWKPSQN